MFIIYTENNHIVIHKGKGEWAVMSAYDILTGIQLCMMIVMIGYGISFFKGRTCRIWCFGGPAVLVTFWSAAVVYYYTAYLFLTILCFLMAFFLGLGLGLWFKAGLPELTYCRARHLLRCPPMPGALLFNILICLAFAAIQAGVYHFPFLMYSWLFNEVLGFVPGLFSGLLWGRGLSMLLDIPTRGQQVYKDI